MQNSDLSNFPTLVPSIYSKKKFIEFIAKYLSGEDGLKQKYEFFAGKNLKVAVVKVSDTLSNVTYSYQESIPPTGTITQFTAEYGTPFPANSETIQIEVTRKSFPLESIAHASVDPALSLGPTDLVNIVEGAKYTGSFTNRYAVDGNSKNMAVGGTFEDSQGSSGKLDSKINRKTRHFIGTSPSIGFEDDYHSGRFSSNLSGVPSKISVYVGQAEDNYAPEHVCIVTTSEIELQQNGSTIPLEKEVKAIASNPNYPSYTKTYNVYKTKATITAGPADFDVKFI